MTYSSRGRSMAEVIVAVTFAGFLTGFVAVLCIGNYYRAKRAMERQKLKRIARLASGGGNGLIDSPHSSTTDASQRSAEQHHLLPRSHDNVVASRQRRKLEEFLSDDPAANMLPQV